MVRITLIGARSLALAAIVMLPLTACSSGESVDAEEPAAAVEFEASGTVSVPYDLGLTYVRQQNPDGELKDGGKCGVDSPYRDLDGGAQLVIRSSDGKILRSTELNEPTLAKEATRCRLSFSLDGVKIQEDDIYEVAVGNASRGTLVSSQAELEEGLFITLK